MSQSDDAIMTGAESQPFNANRMNRLRGETPIGIRALRHEGAPAPAVEGMAPPLTAECGAGRACAPAAAPPGAVGRARPIGVFSRNRETDPSSSFSAHG
ncbi:hypothetical protein [Pikeienuella sp. HZG-20]|uniref:hypothetical protein n=1 Tax=Paludibacillus litoralis TaxID=3133267 RepID=UPI0030EB8F66